MNRFNKHIIVVGSARSGTSWLSETLARPYRYRMLFEPEQETLTKRGFLICDKWLTTKEDSIEAYQYLNAIFKNQVDCDWIAQLSNRKFKRHLWPFIPKKFIIKFVRCNLSAHFINRHFGIPVIHIIRNPYEVIRSQQQVKFPWLYDLSHFTKQEKLVHLIQKVFNYDITSYHNLSDVGILTLRWCLENVIPLEVLEPYSGKAMVLRYEELSNNMELFYDICENFNLETISNLEMYFKKPSSKTHPDGFIFKKQKENYKLPKLVEEEINSILDIFHTRLYARNY